MNSWHELMDLAAAKNADLATSRSAPNLSTAHEEECMGTDPLSLVSVLVDAGNIDTVYRDVYIGRARTLLSPVLSADEFSRIGQQRAKLAELPLALARAVDHGNWSLVKDLSRNAEALQQLVNADAKRFETARGVYAAADVRLDPFCHSLEKFTGVSRRELPALQARVMEQLAMLEQADAAWGDFYAGRRTAFQTRAPISSGSETEGGDPTASVESMRAAAAEALKKGDMRRLAQLADAMSTAAASPTAAVAGTAAASPTTHESSDALVVSWSSDTLTRARRLGLDARRLEPRVDLASLRRYAWSPSSDESGDVDVKQVPLPSGSPDGLRDVLEVLMIHPLVNSGGARHLPALLAEDVLVEDFPDPGEGQEPPPSPLLTALELPRRRGLSRDAIERALLAHGARVLETELGLDPRVFRLVCIPSDLYVRLGEKEGWGRQPYWTHFDGYLIRTVHGQLRLQALAGGDVRYGGRYDLLGVGRDYDTDRLLARFAVVNRARMVAW